MTIEPQPRIRLLLVEDKHLIAEALDRLLSLCRDLEVVAIAGNRDDAVHQLSLHTFDLVLLDLQIPLRPAGRPKVVGFEVLEYLRQSHKGMKVIILSNLNGYSFIKQAERSGADGYLMKNTNFKELYEAIVTVHGGGSCFQGQVKIQRQSKAEDDNAHEPVVAFARLTKREREVVALLSHGFTSKDIALELKIKAGTINEYRDNIISKLDARNTADMIRIVYENGLLEA